MHSNSVVKLDQRIFINFIILPFIFIASEKIERNFCWCFSFSAIGKLNGGHQAAVMAIAVDRWESKDIVLTGSKDHYIKVCNHISDTFQTFLM